MTAPSPSHEATPLLLSPRSRDSNLPLPTPVIATAQRPVKIRRNVTFNSDVQTFEDPRSTPGDVEAQFTAFEHTARPSASTSVPSASVISTLNNKLRRRNSNPPGTIPTAASTTTSLPVAKAGPQRTTKVAQKLKILPTPEKQDNEANSEDANDDDNDGDGTPDASKQEGDVYKQYNRLKDPRSRYDAARLGKADRQRLPRVTAYCTAGSYDTEEVKWFLRGCRHRGAAPKPFDECIYSPFTYDSLPRDLNQARRYTDSVIHTVPEQTRWASSNNNHPINEHQSDVHKQQPHQDHHYSAGMSQDPHPPLRGNGQDMDIVVHTPEVFIFGYGTVVIWGMSVEQELLFLDEIAQFAEELLHKNEVKTEDFNFYYHQEYQARIYNDFISLRLQDKTNYMNKLAISHALSQSVKTTLFENLLSNTINLTKDIPAQIATTGKVNLSRREINMRIGQLFILRINIHLQGSVLDAPELMWAEPHLDPVYQAVRSYLEIDQRVTLLTERLSVIADLLAVLKDQLTHTHGEYLEWIVIILIAAEILVALCNILVDLYAGD